MARRKSDGGKKKKKTPPPAPKTSGRRKQAREDDERLDDVLDIDEDEDEDDEEDADFDDDDFDLDDEEDDYEVEEDEDDDLDEEDEEDEDYFGPNIYDLEGDDSDTEDYFGESDASRKVYGVDDEDEEKGRRRPSRADPPACAGTEATAWGYYLRRLPARVQARRDGTSSDSASGLPRLDLLVSPLQGGVTVLTAERGSGLRSLALQMSLAALKSDPGLGVVYLALDDVSVDTTYDMILCNQSQVDIVRRLEDQMTLAQTHRVALAKQDLSARLMRRMRVLGRAWHEGAGLGTQQLQQYCQDFMASAGVSRLLLAVVPVQGMALPSAMGGDGGTPAEQPAQAAAASDADQWRVAQVLSWHTWSRWARDEGWPALVVSEGPKAQNDALLARLRPHPALRTILELRPGLDKDDRADTTPVTLRVTGGGKGKATDIALTFYQHQFRFTEAPGRD